ncbi:MAG: flagellar basal-body MS-ring/collar protein FliF [Verrucomicrobiota bacterium]
MNELKKTMLTLWAGLTGPQKVSLIASVLVVCAALMTLVYFSSQPKMTLLYANLAAEEASKVTEHLQSKKIPFTLEDGGRSILVPSGKVYELRLSLAAAGIPRASDTAGGVGFELFDKTTFGMSDFMQKANYHRALQGELARTIRQMEEIEEARVMIVVPEDRLFRNQTSEAKASVFLRLKQSRRLSEEKIQAVRFLVANGVEGLQPERVAVIDNFGHALAENQQSNTPLAMSSNQIELVTTTEERLREKAQSMLDQVLGPGQAVVRVTAELDFDAIQETAEKFDPQSAVIRSESITAENSKSKTETAGGVTGVAANVEGNKTGASSSPSSNEQSREVTNNNYEINRVVESKQKAMGSIKRLTVAVFINARKTAAAATGEEAPKETTTTPRTPQEIKALEDIVKQAVGLTQDNQRKDSIQIMEMAFADMFAGEEKEPAKKDIMADVMTWMPYISQGFLILLAGAVFFYFRNVLKSGSAGENEFADLVARFEKNGNGTNGALNGRLGGASGSNPSMLTVEEMTKIIRENPNNTTQALKQWLVRV